MPALSGKFIPG